MWEELQDRRAKHPEASFDEIAAQVTPRRRALMGQLMVHLACQHGDGEVVEGLRWHVLEPRWGSSDVSLRSVLLSERWDEVWATLRPLSQICLNFGKHPVNFKCVK